MAEIVDIGHEVDLSEYDSTATDSGDLSQAGGAALASTSGGLSVVVDDANIIYGQKDFVRLSGTSYRVRVYLDPNGFSMSDGDHLIVCQLNNSGDYRMRIGLSLSGASYQVRAQVYDDGGSSDTVGPVTISDAEHYIEVLVTYASGADAEDGVITLWVDGGQEDTDTTVDLFTRLQPDGVQLGALNFIVGTPTGTLYLDELVVRDDNSEIGAVSVGGIPIGAIAIHHRRQRA
jgi:hypothetical protein